MISDMGIVGTYLTTAMGDYLEENGLATEEEIILVADINGWKRETMEDILYQRSGYQEFDQLADWDGFFETWLENQEV